MSFDLEAFSSTLFRESVDMIPKVLDDVRHEQVYSVALYGSGDDWCYMFPTVSTVAGLRRAANAYRRRPRYLRFSLEELETWLKWNPCDSPHHLRFAESMPATDALLSPLFDLMLSLSDRERDALHAALVESCLQVLERLDAEGHFGAGAARGALTVNLLNGDQSDAERLARARRLNPGSVADRLNEELAAARGVWSLLSPDRRAGG